VQAVDDVAKEFSKHIEAQANNYVRKSKMLQLLRSNKLTNKVTGNSFSHSMSPYPSEQKCRTHPSIKWDMRAEELMLIQATGTPVNKRVEVGEQWFIIDATWFKHWITFVASSRRRAPPGPIDNLWMINPLTDSPYEHMVEDSDDISGDFRRVPPQIWDLFETWYGGGPAISVVGPPTEDTRRWKLHIDEAVEKDDDEKLVDLLGKLAHPEDVIRSDDTHLVVDLHHGTRRPSLAEMSLLAKVGGFHDGGHDKVASGLDAIMDSGSSDDEDDSDGEYKGGPISENSSEKSSTVYAPLTPNSLAVFDRVEDSEDEEEAKSIVASEPKPKEEEIPPAEEPKKEEAPTPKKKRGSIFSR
jgi:hypothetical protein